ncbi:MAG TPA: cysteine desulfurase-like protein [Marmoricola sp.]|nr:cysteine desulfurase-like protein [Marmoricola sp.]
MSTSSSATPPADPRQASPAFDVAAFRRHFPQLVDGAAHFDGPGGSQTPDVVAEAIAGTLTRPLANRGAVTEAERNAEAAVRSGREALADLTGGVPGGVVFGRSMTALTFDLARTLAKDWAPGDEVVVTRLDHDANIRPWVIAAERAGAVVRWADFDPATTELDPEAVGALLTRRTRLVAVTAASNLVGTMPDVRAIADLAHEVGALAYVDGVHYSAHAPVDVEALGADFFACSPYKFLGPHCGAVVADPALLASLHPDKLLPSSDEVPERFELGTLPYELMAGTAAAVDLLASLVPAGGSRRERLVASMCAVHDHEEGLRRTIEDAVAVLPGAVVHSRARRHTPTLLVSLDGVDMAEVHRFLGTRGVNAPAGSFYALEASRHLGLGDSGALRIGLAPYNDADDVDRLLDGLQAFVASR